VSFHNKNKSNRGASRFLGAARWLGVAGALLLSLGLTPSASAQVTSSVANLTGDPLYWTNSAIWWSSAPDGAYPGATVDATDDWVLLTNDLSSYTVILNSGLSDPIGRLNINYLSTTSSTGKLTTVVITNGASTATILTNTQLRLGTGARLQIDSGGVVTGVTQFILGGTNAMIYLNEGGKLFNGVNNITLGNNFSNMNATVTTSSQNGGVWNMNGNGFYVGYNAATGSVLTVSGSVTLTNVGTTVNMQVGGGGASWNSLILSNGAKLFGGTVYIAFTGSGNGGSNNLYQIGGLGAESMVSNGAIYISQQGARNNSIILTNARWTTGGAVNIGENVGSSNNISVYANSTWNLLAQTISVGNGTGFSNTLTVTGGTVTNAGAVNVGTGGARGSVLTIQDGGKFFSRAVTVGGSSSANSNQYNVGGFGLSSTVTNWAITVGASTSRGYNKLNITNALLLAGASTIGNGSSNNAAVVSSGGLWNLVGTELNIGISNAINNSLTVNIGGVVTNANITVGQTGPGGPAATANNQLIVNGGAVWASALRVTNAANVVTFNSGTIGVTSTTYSNGTAFVVGNGVNAATLQLGSGVHSFEKGINLLTNSYLKGNGATLGATITNTIIGGNIAIGADGGNTFTINGVMTGSANQLTKQDAGTVILAGNNDFSAPVVVSAGTLTVSNNSGIGLPATAPVSVSSGGNLFVNNTGASTGVVGAVTVSGGLLSGTGTISGNVVLNTGTLTAGNNNIGTLTMGSLTVNGGYLPFEFLTSGLDNDHYDVTTSGGLTINGGTVLLYTNNSTVRFDAAGVYNLIKYSGSISGTGVSGFVVGNPDNLRTYNFGTAGGYVTLGIGGFGMGWNPGSPTGDTWWTNSANWGGGTGPAPVEFDQLLFSGNTKVNNTNNFASNTRFSGIVFTNTAGTFVLNGMAADTNTVNLVGNVINRSVNTQTINLPLVLDSGSRAFNTLNGNMIANGVISGSDSTAGLIKQGSKVLELTGANTYSGITEIVSGTLRANSGAGLPTASNLKFNGGVLESIGAVNVTRTLGTGNGSLQWAGDGGFSAYGGKMTVNLGGSGAGVTWGSGSFVPAGNTLIFGSGTANSEVEFINAIDLDGGVRTIRVNPGVGGDYATLKGVISNGSLTKSGAGKLVLMANNTYTGATLVNDGTLIVHGSLVSGTLSLSGGSALAGTGTLASVISGAGRITPGLSPGILTVNQVDPAGGLDFNFEFTQLGSPDYTQAGASGNDVLRITNSLPFTVALGIANTINLQVSAALVVGQTNVFRGGFYTDNSALFDDKLSNATFTVSGPGVGALVYWKTVNEAAFSQNGSVLEFGVLGQTVVSVVPEPNVFVLWLAGAVTFWAARRRRSRK